MSVPALEVADVAKSYGSLSVLGSVSLAVAAGEAVGVVGPNGAGKTTLLDLLSGTGRCDAGRVLLHGRDVTRLPPPLRARMGLGRTFQVPRPLAGLTVFENALVGSMRAAGLRGRQAYRAAYEALAVTGMADQANTRAGSLRLLDRKRLELARALAMRPRLMLLDEVTSALDPELVADVLDVIRELAEGGMTMLIATHEMGFARDIASRVCFLADGQIVEQAPPAQLFSQPSDERTQRFLRRITDAGRM